MQYSHNSICCKILRAEIINSDGTSGITIKCEFDVEVSRFGCFYITITTFVQTVWWSNKSQRFPSNVNEGLQCLCRLTSLWWRIWKLKRKCFQKVCNILYIKFVIIPPYNINVSGCQLPHSMICRLLMTYQLHRSFCNYLC